LTAVKNPHTEIFEPLEPSLRQLMAPAKLLPAILCWVLSSFRHRHNGACSRLAKAGEFVRIAMLELAKGVNPAVIADQLGRLTFTSELVWAIDHL